MIPVRKIVKKKALAEGCRMPSSQKTQAENLMWIAGLRVVNAVSIQILTTKVLLAETPSIEGLI